jgi:hypothetical protein
LKGRHLIGLFDGSGYFAHGLLGFILHGFRVKDERVLPEFPLDQLKCRLFGLGDELFYLHDRPRLPCDRMKKRGGDNRPEAVEMP